MFVRLLVLILGVFCCSTAILFIKESHEHPILLAAYRLFVASIALLPLFIRDYRRHRGEFGLRELRRSFLPGLLLGVHFISWIIAARRTTAANASLIVNLVPVAMPFLLHFVLRESLSKREIIGTVIAVAGLFVLGGSDFNWNPEHFKGDLLSFVSMLFFAMYLVLGRRNRRTPTPWLYLVPLYSVAGVFCFLVALPFVDPIKAYPWREVRLILALGLIPTVLGHSILNASMQRLRGQLVSIVNMGQFVFAGTMAYLLLGENPSPAFYLACVLVVGGAVTVVAGHGSAKSG